MGINSKNFLSANTNQGIERLQDDDVPSGYDYNRIVDAVGRQTIEWPLGWGLQEVDITFQTRNRFWLTTDITFLASIQLAFSLQPLHVAQQSTAAGVNTGSGTSHNHGSAAHAHSHQHNLFIPFAGAGGTLNIGATGPIQVSAGGVNITDTQTVQTDATSTTPGATGSEASHTHNLPALTFIPPTALYETGMAMGSHVFIDGIDRTTSLAGPWGTGTALDVGPVDITNFISNTGWHEINISSTALGSITAQIYVKAVIPSV